MKSGTIMHLALLRKIRERSPIQKMMANFNKQCSVKSYSSRCHPYTSYTSRQLSQNFSSSREKLNFVRKKSNSFDHINDMKNQSKLLEDQLFTLSGWNSQKDQERACKKVLKGNTFRSMENQEHPFTKIQARFQKPSNQRKFTYCQRDLKQFLKQFTFSTKKVDIKAKLPKKELSKKLRPLIIEEAKTQQNVGQLKNPFGFDKQNQVCQFFKAKQSAQDKKRLNKKSKIQKINDLVRQYNETFNLHKI